MADTGLLGLYWDPRRQSLEDCANACLRALLVLADNGFTTYYLKGKSRKDALRRPLNLSPESIKSVLASGVNRRDDTRAPIPELGFHFSAWSGHPNREAYSVSALCGSWSEPVSNNFLVNLPAVGPYSIASARTSLKKVFPELVAVWAPDSAVLCDSKDLTWENRRLAPTMRSYERFERASA